MKNIKYEAMRDARSQQLKTLERQFSRCSLLRILSAMVIAACLVFAYWKEWHPGYALAAAAAVIFFGLVKKHDRIEEKQNRLGAEKEVLEEYLARFTQAWREFPDTGAVYLTSDFPQGRDLDVFGKHSLYQYLCTAQTAYGKRRLAECLQAGDFSTEQIKQRQEAVGELAENPEFFVCIQALAKGTKQADQEIIEAFLAAAEQEKKPSLFLATIMWGLPLFSLFFLTSAILNLYRAQSLGFFFLLAAVQLLCAFLGFRKNHAFLQPIYQFNRSMKAYRMVFQKIEQADFRSAYLKKLRKQMREAGGAAHALRSLERIGEGVKQRHNGIAFLLYNSILMWDFHCVDRFREWKEQYRSLLRPWLETAAELEVLFSLAVPCCVRDRYTFPEIMEAARPELRFRALSHPLIQQERAVANDFAPEENIVVITGSNMSGKTTFLRTIGLNLILAYAGGPVLAESFCASKMRMFTSMRVEDRVAEGISTFYAELLRIKEMVEFSQEKQPMLALIDEIFKGTNSKDRIEGAKAAVRRLGVPWSMVLVTTHDFELCNLDGGSANYHFSEHYTEKEILFDYKIKPGRCTTTNAKYLLRLAGIL